jgi:hypothetical protein
LKRKDRKKEVSEDSILAMALKLLPQTGQNGCYNENMKVFIC